MKCKPGDMAFILKNSNYQAIAGWVVNVLYLAPATSFTLPNGDRHAGAGSERWVCESAGSDFIALRGDGTKVHTRYGVLPDWVLQPIRPGEVKEHEEPEVIYV